MLLGCGGEGRLRLLGHWWSITHGGMVLPPHGLTQPTKQEESTEALQNFTAKGPCETRSRGTGTPLRPLLQDPWDGLYDQQLMTDCPILERTSVPLGRVTPVSQLPSGTDVEFPLVAKVLPALI